MSVTMRYGQRSDSAPQRLPDQPGGGGMELVASGEVVQTGSATLTLTAGATYLLAVKQYRYDSGAYRGLNLIMVSAPEGENFGTTAAAHTAAASDGTGATITYPDNSTVTVAPSSNTHTVRYALYKIM